MDWIFSFISMNCVILIQLIISQLVEIEVLIFVFCTKMPAEVILILSGKGGVGKTTFACQLAMLISEQYKVGLLDLDLCGPSVPTVLGLKDHLVHESPLGWTPVYADKEEKLAVMSVGFLLNNQDSAIIWRGPKKEAMVEQFVKKVNWGDVDFLIVDTPPGTSDEHISVVQHLENMHLAGAVIVTTPQEVSLIDAAREISFCKVTGINILGVVENMSGYLCPYCDHVTNVLSSHTGVQFCQQHQVDFLGQLPIEIRLSQCMEDGKNFCKLNPESNASVVFKDIWDKISRKINS
ncbi:Cytosolic Fe-S cluster assembly factor NUBP2 -like protein [Trichinella nelsoni]|uniref:Cytosolic Fe-S cluster assembly factor NUBP2-like protein n=1 Tax=Trichinella nelsoni TaxID=6336 RepID=A0A0V0SLL2_9BILA|nr:Cytosolic Fe-S cluster assembly factor NUBP2 -like protein [Trichinella nelsoni]